MIFQLLSFWKRKMIFGYNRSAFIRRVLGKTLFLPISIVVTFYFKKNTEFLFFEA